MVAAAGLRDGNGQRARHWRGSGRMGMGGITRLGGAAGGHGLTDGRDGAPGKGSTRMRCMEVTDAPRGAAGTVWLGTVTCAAAKRPEPRAPPDARLGRRGGSRLVRIGTSFSTTPASAPHPLQHHTRFSTTPAPAPHHTSTSTSAMRSTSALRLSALPGGSGALRRSRPPRPRARARHP